MINIFGKILAALTAHSGKEWKEVKGEIHKQYNEMPFWILLYHDSNILSALKLFQEIVIPYMDKIEGVQITVGFQEFTSSGDKFIFHEFLENNEQIIAGHGDWPFASMKEEGKFTGTMVFESRNSQRE